MAEFIHALRWTQSAFRAGERVAVAVSGGADSVALLLAVAESRAITGIVLSAVHFHHGLRGAAADGDAQFVAELAARLDAPLHMERGDVASFAAERGQGIEEAARTLRYGVFHKLLEARIVDAVATAHTRDDQAETVLMKLLRGAWTEGLGGIAPVVQATQGRIVRPMLGVTRAEVVAYLHATEQSWREDSTNQELHCTRNRVRHTLLPQVREFSPHIAEQLARMAAVARDEESWWERELARTLPGLVLPGKPVRGGGRANSTQPGEASLAMELDRLRALHPAMQRRALRAAVEKLGVMLSFDQTEALLAIVTSTERVSGKRARVDLGCGVVAERTVRELRLSQIHVHHSEHETRQSRKACIVPVPGMLDAAEYGLRIVTQGFLSADAVLLLRTPRLGDRVRLRHGRNEKTIKEVLERRGIAAQERAGTPVLAIGNHVIWMGGAELESISNLRVTVEPLGAKFNGSDAGPVPEIVPDAPQGNQPA